MFMHILTWYIGLLFHYQLLIESSYPSPILFARNWFRHRAMRLLPLYLSLFGIYHPTRYLTYVQLYKDFNNLRGIGIHHAMSLPPLTLCSYLFELSQPWTFRTIQGFKSLPHNIRWSTVSYSATSITTYKLDCSQTTNFCVQPYKARIFSFSKRPHGLRLQCWA